MLEAFRDPYPADLPFRATRHIAWSNRTGTVVFAGWQDDVELGMGNRWHHTPQGVTAFTGHVWPRSGVWPGSQPWASQLATHLRSRPLQSALEDLLGIFTVVSLDGDGRGIITSDQLGTSILYRAEVPGMTILASRAGLAARLANGSPRRDVVGAGWLAYCGQPIGTQTSFESVEVVPLGAQANVTPTGVTLRHTTPPWRSQLDGDRAVLLEEVYSDIVTSIRAALSYPVERRVVELTGGMDSRLILAVLLAEGLADQFEYHTFGPPDLPDVKVAKRLAGMFGLRHVEGHDPARQQRSAVRRARLTAEHPDRSLRELQLRSNVGAWSCARNAWQMEAAAPPCGDRVALIGMYGETLSTNFPQTTPIRTHAEMRQALLVNMRFGAAGILRSEALEHYQRELMAVTYDGFSHKDPPHDVMDASYLRDRLRRWFGTTQEADEQTHVCPLHSPIGVRLAFSLGPRDRRWSWIYRELYRNAFPSLADEPFTSGRWPQARVPDRLPEPKRLKRLRNPTDARSAARVLLASQRRRWGLARATGAGAAERRESEATDVEIMRHYLLDSPTNPVFDIVDRVALERAITSFSRLGELSRRQLYGALTAAIWLGRHEISPAPT